MYSRISKKCPPTHKLLLQPLVRLTIGHWPVAGSGRAITCPGRGRRARLTRGSCQPRVPVGLKMLACSCLIHPDSGNSMQEHARDNIAPHKGPMWMQQAKRQQVEGKKLQGYFGTYENTLTFVTACGPKAIKYV